MAVMGDEYLLGLLVRLVQRSSEWLLEARGEVAPYSVKLIGDGGTPKTFFPQDLNATAEWPLLLDAAIDALRLDEKDGDVVAVAACTGLVSPNTDRQAFGEAFGAQLETRTTSAFVLVRYHLDGEVWRLDSPVFLDNLLRPEGLR